jgi:hypothetical protein
VATVGPGGRTKTLLPRIEARVSEPTEERYTLNQDRGVMHFRGGDTWLIWLNQKQDFDGICLGRGATRAEAILDAIDLLDELIMRLVSLEDEGTR